MVEGYPIVLRLVGKRCLVVGGGNVAERKVERLLACGALVTVVSPNLTPALEEWEREEKITWLRRPYQEGDVEGFSLVFAASNDLGTNRAVGEEARKRGVFCNLVDNPEQSSFFTPAVLEWEGMIIAVASEGKSPFLVGTLRRWLEENLPHGLGKLLDVLEEKRKAIKKTTMTLEEKKCYYQKLLEEGEVLRKGDES